MENILIVKESFENINGLEQFFLSKNLVFKILRSDELSQVDSPKSVLICDKRYAWRAKITFKKISQKKNCCPKSMFFVDNRQ